MSFDQDSQDRLFLEVGALRDSLRASKAHLEELRSQIVILSDASRVTNSELNMPDKLQELVRWSKDRYK